MILFVGVIGGLQKFSTMILHAYFVKRESKTLIIEDIFNQTLQEIQLFTLFFISSMHIIFNTHAIMDSCQSDEPAATLLHFQSCLGGLVLCSRVLL